MTSVKRAARPIKLAVFDCDGTLVDSAANIVAAMTSACRNLDLSPPTDAAIRHIVGLSLEHATAALMPDAAPAVHGALADEYRRVFHALRASGGLAVEPLYPGMARVLAALAGAGWVLGVATGKSDRGLALILGHHGIAAQFVTLQTADRHPSKPHPAMLAAAMAAVGAEPDETAMIGDTTYDMAMAVAAGARAIGVSWGYHPPAALREAGAAAVVDTADALLAMLA